ncbi:MAG TPA: hypothetical protein VGM90_00735 [Kofleriaceae bacterium]
MQRLLVLCALTGCFSTPAFHGASSDDVEGDDASVVDAGLPATNCGAFGMPTKLEAVSATIGDDREPVVTRDGLQLFFENERNLMRSKRSSTSEMWPPASLLSVRESNTQLGAVIDGVWVTDDSRKMWLSHNGKLQHATQGADETDPYVVDETVGTDLAYGPTAVDDDSLFIFDSGGAAPGQAFALTERTKIEPNASHRFYIQTGFDERSPSLGNRGTYLVWTSQSTTDSEILEDDWPTVTTAPAPRHIVLDGIAKPNSPFLTDDGKTLYFSATSGSDTTLDLYMASRTCN